MFIYGAMVVWPQHKKNICLYIIVHKIQTKCWNYEHTDSRIQLEIRVNVTRQRIKKLISHKLYSAFWCCCCSATVRCFGYCFLLFRHFLLRTYNISIETWVVISCVSFYSMNDHKMNLCLYERWSCRRTWIILFDVQNDKVLLRQNRRRKKISAEQTSSRSK